MKKIGFVLFAAVAALSVMGCGGKSHVLSGENPQFTASVVEEKNPDGKKTPYFAMNNYRVPFDSKKDAVAYFEQFKKRYDGAEAEARPSIVFGELDGLELHAVKKVGDILYVDLSTDPNYAETGPSYSSMSTNELLDLYENETRTVLSVMAELSDRKLSSKQEKRLYQIAESLADEFDSEF